jgi:regulator of RNase E activity RraA
VSEKIKVDPRVRSAVISDCMDQLGLKPVVMNGSIQPLDPNSKAVGYARTISFIESAEHDAENPYAEAINFLDSLNNLDLVVIAVDGSQKSAFWGELFSIAARARGAVGVVCDGALRDSREIREIGFPAFGSGTRPFDFKGRMKVSKVDTDVLCGGVVVAPGDLVCADNDAVVVVAQLAIDEVITLANTRVSRENLVLRDLLNNKSVKEVWDRYRIL